MTDSSRPTLGWRRIVVGALALVTAFHLFATFLWIAPPSPLRDVLPDKVLRSYMLPMFGQSWSVFAPEPVNGDTYVEVRAVVEETGEATPWVSATKAELTQVTGNLFPARAGIVSWTLGASYRTAYNAASEADQGVVAAGYYNGDDWQSRLSAAIGDDDAASRSLARNERTLSAYATQVAYALWGDQELRAVQVRITRQNVLPFEKRDTPDAVPEPSVIELGWRGFVENEGQSRDAFADTFRRLVDASGQEY